VRTLPDRDDRTVAIAGALGIFGAVLLVVALLAWGTQWLTHGLDGHESALTWPTILVAAAAAGTYLARTGR
jgi:hypothetical protein